MIELIQKTEKINCQQPTKESIYNSLWNNIELGRIPLILKDLPKFSQDPLIADEQAQ